MDIAYYIQCRLISSAIANRRKYQSKLRKIQSEATRSKIISAARVCFEDKGFAKTTIAAVAKEAGVSAPTVYSIFRSKGGLVEALLADLEPAEVSLKLSEEERPRSPRQQVKDFVDGHCAICREGETIIRAVLAAAAEGLLFSSMGNQRRRQYIDGFTSTWSASDLRAGMTPKQAAEHIWLLSTVEHFIFVRDELDWSAARYGEWLLSTITRQVLADP